MQRDEIKKNVNFLQQIPFQFQCSNCFSSAMLLAYQQHHSTNFLSDSSTLPLHNHSLFPTSSTNSDSHMSLHSKLPNNFISKPHKNLIQFSTSSNFTVSMTQTYTASSKENPSFFHEIPTKEFYQSFNFYSPEVLLPLTLFVWL